MNQKPVLKQSLSQFLAAQPQKKENNFNYSLCESIDYQRESLLGNQQPA
jgi:hypothetical protein